MQNKKVNDNSIIHISNYFKCKWTKCRKQKTQIDWIKKKKKKKKKKARSLYMLSTRDPPKR